MYHVIFLMFTLMYEVMFILFHVFLYNTYILCDEVSIKALFSINDENNLCISYFITSIY